MGILRSGILGHLSGKTAGVVGGKWKDKSYIREYVIPANPNTTPQQTQRAKFAVGVAFLKALVGQVLNVYVDKFQKSMSGFNYILGVNMAYWLSPITFASVKIVFGKLWMPDTPTPSASGHDINVSWVGASYGNNGAATDHVYACAYSPTTGLWFFAAAEVHRSVGGILIPVGIAEVGNTLHVYIWSAKYSVTSATLLEMVSDSQHVSQVIA